MVDIVQRQTKRGVKITRKKKPQILKELDSIEAEISPSFSDAIVLLTTDLLKQASVRRALEKGRVNQVEIDWNTYQNELRDSLLTYSKMMVDEVLSFEGYERYHESVRPSINSWVETNARTEALDVAERSKKAFRQNFRNYQERKEEKRPSPLIIKTSLGLAPDHTKAINNFLIDKRDDFSLKQAREKTMEYIRNKRRYRANLIAKTELWEVINKARVMFHNHLFMNGVLDRSKIGKEWIAREGDCKQCQRYDGMVLQWDENFDRKVKFPPAHPNDSCTYRLVKL